MTRHRLTARGIMHRVAVFYGIPSDLLCSHREARRVARPRQVGMWLAQATEALTAARGAP